MREYQLLSRDVHTAFLMIRCGVSLHTKSNLGFAKTGVKIYQKYYEEHIVVQAVESWIQMYLKKNSKGDCTNPLYSVNR